MISKILNQFALFVTINDRLGLPRWLGGKESACQSRRRKSNLCIGQIPLQKEMATHSSILAWEIPWTEESGGLQSMELQRVRGTQ